MDLTNMVIICSSYTQQQHQEHLNDILASKHVRVVLEEKTELIQETREKVEKFDGVITENDFIDYAQGIATSSGLGVKLV